MSYVIEAPDGSPICKVDTFREVVEAMADGWVGVVWYDRHDCPIGPEGQPHGRLTAVVWVGPENPKPVVVARSRFLTVS